MNDNEIIKAFETGVRNCNSCSYGITTQKRKVLDLINRQKAEIERLKIYSENLEISQEHLLNECAVARKTAKSEAIKEFAEQLKKRFYLLGGNCVVNILQIDNLVKQMTEAEK